MQKVYIHDFTWAAFLMYFRILVQKSKQIGRYLESWVWYTLSTFINFHWILIYEKVRSTNLTNMGFSAYRKWYAKLTVLQKNFLLFIMMFNLCLNEAKQRHSYYTSPCHHHKTVLYSIQISVSLFIIMFWYQYWYLNTDVTKCCHDENES